MSGTREIEDILDRYEQDFRWLLEQVEGCCGQVRSEFGSSVVDDVYTRSTAPGIKAFKEPFKIAAKIRQRGQPLSAESLLLLNDIIGITIVLKYPDDIERVWAALDKSFGHRKIVLSKPERHEAKNGYYATHGVCTAVRNGESLRCEVQIKTMLHDAWSAKMHDLTYKPSGVLDPRLAALMISIADTIESLEQQSRLIRDMIQSNWNIEADARRFARKAVFEKMLAYNETEVWEDSPDPVRELRARLDDAQEWLASEPTDSARLQELLQRLTKCCADSQQLRFGWMLAGKLASERPAGDLNRVFANHAEAFVRAAPLLLKAGAIDLVEVRAVPLVYYVIGDIDGAIEQSEEILQGGKIALTPRHRAMAEFNRVNFVLEREYHTPTKDPAVRGSIRAELEQTLRGEDIQNYDDETFPSCLRDAEGLLAITFAESVSEARRGIEDCVSARTLSDPGEQAISDAYADLNMRLGWRRYFELELKSAPARV